MRLLFFTDTHLRGTPPEARTDNFNETVKDKLAEVASLARRLGAGAVIHGGDFFDVPEPGLAHVGECVEILARLPVPLYTVPGNHDIHGHNPSTLPRTLLGFLVRLGAVKLLGRDPVFLSLPGDKKLQLTGQGFHAEIDRRDWVLDYVVGKKETDFAVHVVHGMLLPRGIVSSASFLPAATPAEDVLAATKADVTLCGHYHIPWEARLDGKLALNPGALVRLSARPEEVGRVPQVLLLEFSEEGFSHKYIPLRSARPGSEVLDRSHLDAARARAGAREAFLAGLGEFRGERFAAMEPAEVLRETLARLGAGPDVAAEAWRRLQTRLSEGGVVYDRQNRH